MPWSLEGGRLVLEPVPRPRLSSFLMIRDAGVALIPQSIAWNQLTRSELVQWGVVTGVDVGLWVLPRVRRVHCERFAAGSLVLKG